MKQATSLIGIILFLSSCHHFDRHINAIDQLPIQGTWQLISGTTIQGHDTVNTDYTKAQEMIKIINATHFAFLMHNVSNGKDSAVYSSGGGRYELKGDQYTEHLDYCNDRQWEGHTFSFTITLHDDTLVQSGIEKVEETGTNRLNIERYHRAK